MKRFLLVVALIILLPLVALAEAIFWALDDQTWRS